jgi:hypothetical protein
MKTFKKNCGTSRLTDVQSVNNEIKLQEDLLIEATQLYGTKISYYVHGYSLSSHDWLYGEDVTAKFNSPVEVVVLAEMNQDSLLLSRFGIMNDADLTVIIPIRTFNEYFSAFQQYPEPKSGDLIRLDELGVMRPGGGYEFLYSSKEIIEELSGIKQCKQPEEFQKAFKEYLSAFQDEMNQWLRSAPVFEITERRDLAPQLNINRLQGVYAWHIKAKRYDYSYEPEAPVERGNDQVSDETFFGRLSGGENPESPQKKYPQNAQDESDKIFDYNENGNLDSIYGDF